MAALSHRLKSAIFGFGITVAPLAIVATAHLAFMPYFVAATEGLDGHDRALTVSNLRTEWFAMHSIAAIIFAAYWIIAALGGKGQTLKPKVANGILTFCVITYLLITLYFISFRWTEGLKILCPVLGISDTDAPPFVFDAQSSCGAFASATHLIILLGLPGLVVPLVISLVVRIVSSRRAYQQSDNAPPPLLE
jgi:hypothetical protein